MKVFIAVFLAVLLAGWYIFGILLESGLIQDYPMQALAVGLGLAAAVLAALFHRQAQRIHALERRLEMLELEMKDLTESK